MNPGADVAIVILNYNGKLVLEKFLPSVLLHSAGHPVIVADNASCDDSLHFLEQNYPSVRIIKNNGNYGYAEGYNLALKQIIAKYYILLNSDVEVTENWIDPIIQVMENNPKIAACQPKILDYADHKSFEYAGASGGYIDKLGYPFCRGRIFNAVETDEGQFDDLKEVFWASGACLFVRASAFNEVEGFDDNYFAHMEEIDLCWRMKNLGHQIYVVPGSLVFHVGGGTLHKLSAKKTFLNFRNNISTLAKNHAPKGLVFIIFYRMLLDGIAAFKFLFDGQPKHFFAVFRAHLNFYLWLPALMRKRKKLRSNQSFIDQTSQIYQGNIVIEHFIQNKTKFKDLQQGFFPEQ